MLHKLVYTVDSVGNSKEAIAALPRQSHALLLMDEPMPVRDGMAATTDKDETTNPYAQ